MRIRLAIPDDLDDRDRKEALDAALESVTRTVSSMVKKGTVPPAAGQIKAKRVRWQPEPPGDEHFDLPTTILARGHGDCDDLAPWHAGSLRAGGIDPGARAIVKKSGPKRWHAVVRRSDGSIEDPSAHAGMHSVSGVASGAPPSLQPPMSGEGRLCIALCPSRDPRYPGVWFARTDVPDAIEPWEWSSLAAHTHPAKALLHSVKGARVVCGSEIDGEDYARLGALNDLVLGADPREVMHVLGELLGDEVLAGDVLGDAMHSVGFFGGLLKGLGKIATAPLSLVSKIPGASGLLKMALPMAGTAFGGPFGAMAGNMLAKMIPGGGGGGHGGGGGGFGLPFPIPGFGGGHGGGGGFGIPGLNIPGLGNLGNIAQLASHIPGMPMPGGGHGGGGGFPFPLPFKIPGLNGVDGAADAVTERGVMVRPWGVNGPAVMRF